MSGREKGVAERVQADCKAIRAGRSDEDLRNRFDSEIQARPLAIPLVDREIGRAHV